MCSDNLNIKWYQALHNNKTFTDQLAQNLATTHFIIGNKRWHIDELLCLQRILLINAPSLKEGIIWWCKALCLFDRTLFVENKNANGFLSLIFKAHSNGSLPIFSYSITQNLLTQLGAFSKFQHSWIQTKTHNFPQLRTEFFNGLKIHFDLQEINTIAAPEPVLFKFAKQVLQLLLQQNIEKEDLTSRLKKQIYKHIDSPLRLADLAKNMGLSPRTLQRRLQEKQLNFSCLVEEQKKTIALSLLADTDLHASSIANRLGYDDASNFHRAFRKWYPFTPQNYREQCINNRILQKNNPVRLHYAIWNGDEAQIQQGRVWLEVDNIAFEKNVSVKCQDRDGVWRHYPAFFDYFLSEGTELWSTANLPVAGPLRFKLCYEINGKKFINDNQQHNYVVDDGLLIGQPLIVLPNIFFVEEADGFRIIIELVCKKLDIAKVQCIIDGRNNNSWSMRKTRSKNSCQTWSLSCYLSSAPQRCVFELQTLDEQKIYCDNYQHGYLFSTPLSCK